MKITAAGAEAAVFWWKHRKSEVIPTVAEVAAAGGNWLQGQRRDLKLKHT